MKKKLLSVTALVAGFVGIFILGSCDNNGTEAKSNENQTQETTNTGNNNTENNDGNNQTENSNNNLVTNGHEWQDEWTYDEKNHWHECKSSECDLIFGVDKHTFGDDGKCTVCGYKPEKTQVDADSVKEILIYDYIQASSRESKVLQRVFNVGDTFNTNNLAAGSYVVDVILCSFDGKIQLRHDIVTQAFGFRINETVEFYNMKWNSTGWGKVIFGEIKVEKNG